MFRSFLARYRDGADNSPEILPTGLCESMQSFFLGDGGPVYLSSRRPPTPLSSLVLQFDNARFRETLGVCCGSPPERAEELFPSIRAHAKHAELGAKCRCFVVLLPQG